MERPRGLWPKGLLSNLGLFLSWKSLIQKIGTKEKFYLTKFFKASKSNVWNSLCLSRSRKIPTLVKKKKKKNGCHIWQTLVYALTVFVASFLPFEKTWIAFGNPYGSLETDSIRCLMNRVPGLRLCQTMCVIFLATEIILAASPPTLRSLWILRAAFSSILSFITVLLRYNSQVM